MESSVSYEFRTTCVKPIIDTWIIEDIAKSIKGGSRYVLQRFCDHEVLNPDYFEKLGSTFEEYELLHLKSVAEPWVNQCIIR
jgi:pyruvate formate lyase activating enzyme